MTLRRRKCEHCREWFMPWSTLQKACPKPACAIAVGRAQKKKAQKKKDQQTKERLKTKGDWTKEAQAAFNRFIRLRDAHQPCISCGRNPDDRDLITGSRWDAGHYRSVGACPELRFEELNVHKQCVHCNKDKSGNAVEFRIRLRERFREQGRDPDATLEWLEGKHEAKRYTIEDLRAILKHYRQKACELERGEKA